MVSPLSLPQKEKQNWLFLCRYHHSTISPKKKKKKRRVRKGFSATNGEKKRRGKEKGLVGFSEGKKKQ